MTHFHPQKGFTHTLSEPLRKARKYPTVQRVSGFTLVETLVAITLLSLSIAGPLYTASHATVATNLTHDRVTAAYLAQEAIEQVRTVRDSAFLASPASGWGTFISTMSTCSVSCMVDPYPYPGTIQACVGSSCTPLYVANNRYTMLSSGGAVTPFTRTISYSGATNTLTAIVSWEHHGVPHSVQIAEQLTPWQ